MNKTTQNKIANAIEKLGKSASWDAIVAESGCSKHTVQKYFHESAPETLKSAPLASAPDEVVPLPDCPSFPSWIVGGEMVPESTPDDRKAIDSSVGGYMEGIINTAKEKIKARGLFPTTPRLIEETSYTGDEIDTYFEERLKERRA